MTEKIRNPYSQNRSMAKLFDTMVEAAQDEGSELYRRARDDGRLIRRTGGLHRCCFWAGVDVERGVLGARPRWVVAGTLGAACFRAGRACVKAGVLPAAARAEEVA